MTGHSLRPSLSVSTPESSAQNICEVKKSVETRPICTGVMPKAATYTEVNGT